MNKQAFYPKENNFTWTTLAVQKLQEAIKLVARHNKANLSGK